MDIQAKQIKKLAEKERLEKLCFGNIISSEITIYDIDDFSRNSSRILRILQESENLEMFFISDKLSKDDLLYIFEAKEMVFSESSFKLNYNNLKKINIELKIMDLHQSDIKTKGVIENYCRLFEEYSTIGDGELSNRAILEKIIYDLFNKKDFKYFTSGIVGIDQLGGKWKTGELVTIGGRTSTGKSHFITNFMCKNINQQTPILLNSAEMSGKENFHRMISNILYDKGIKVTPDEMENKTPSENIAAAIADMTGMLDDLPIFFTPKTASKNIDTFLSYATNLIKNKGIKCICIDHIGLIDGSNPKNSIYEQIREITGKLKKFAMNNDILIVIVSQLNRRTANGEVPHLGDLKESGSIEQDSDRVVLIHRPEEVVNGMNLILAKNRKGRTGYIEIKVDLAHSKFI